MKIFEIFKNPLGKFSIGRIAFAIFFLSFLPIYLYRWVHFGESAIHPSVISLFGLLLGYNVGAKALYNQGNKIQELLKYKDKDEV